jgi:N-acetylmuramoyl-L-alanine amidase
LIVRSVFLLFAAVPLVVASSASAAPPPVVVIDPGHDLRANLRTEPIGPGSRTRKIMDGGGTHGVVSGTGEAELNLAISLRVRALLEGAGLRVVMTRRRTVGTSMGNVARAAIANRAGAALFLRIHADGSTSASARGTHTLYPSFRAGWTDDIYRKSRGAAKVVQSELVRALGFPDLGLQERSDLTGFNWADTPAILVEVGFMTNPAEDRALATRAYRERAARGICRGTLRFLGSPSTRCWPARIPSMFRGD